MANQLEETQGKVKSVARGVRSPNYPIISLAEAVERIQMIWQKELKHAATRENLAKDIGYGSLNGASAGVISALSKFGLLEAAGQDQCKLSEAALDIVLHDRGAPERAQAVQEAAFQPALFTELRTTYSDQVDQLPQDRTIEAHLIKRGFNPKTVGSAIRSYRDTIAFVNEETKGSHAKPKETPMQTLPLVDTRAQTQEGRSEETLSPPPAAKDTQELVFKIGEDATARITLIGHVTQESIKKLEGLLNMTADTFPTKSVPNPKPTLPKPTSPFAFEGGFNIPPSDAEDGDANDNTTDS